MLDVWGPEEKLLVGKHQLYELTNTKPPKPVVPAPDGQLQEGGGGGAGGGADEMSLQSLDSYQFKESSTEEMKPQLIVELQVCVGWIGGVTAVISVTDVIDLCLMAQHRIK